MKKKALAGFRTLIGLIGSRNSQANQKKHGKKHFLQAGSKILNAFCKFLKNFSVRILKQLRDLLSRRMFPNLVRLLTLQKLGGSYFQKCRRFRERKVKMENRKISKWENFFPQKGHFFNTTHHVDTQEHGWKPSNEGFISIATEDDIVPELLLTVCGCKSYNCSNRSCKSCHKFCENIDPKEILGDDSSDVKVISTTKKERTVNNYLHICVSCLLVVLMFVHNNCCRKTISDC